MAERIEELASLLDHLTPKVFFHVGPYGITSTVVYTWVAMAILFAIVFLATRRLEERPGKAQNIVEALVEFVQGLVEQDLGKDGLRYVPLVGTLFLFILFMNLLWFIPGLIPPTSDLSTTAALGVTTILIIHGTAIKRQPRQYFGHYFKPYILMLPLNIMEELVKPFSLSVRLFGNIFGGKAVVTTLAILVPLLLPVPVMLLEVLLGSIQAYVFAMLTVAYLGMMFRHH